MFIQRRDSTQQVALEVRCVWDLNGENGTVRFAMVARPLEDRWFHLGDSRLGTIRESLTGQYLIHKVRYNE